MCRIRKRKKQKIVSKRRIVNVDVDDTQVPTHIVADVAERLKAAVLKTAERESVP